MPSDSYAQYDRDVEALFELEEDEKKKKKDEQKGKQESEKNLAKEK